MKKIFLLILICFDLILIAESAVPAAEFTKIVGKALVEAKLPSHVSAELADPSKVKEAIEQMAQSSIVYSDMPDDVSIGIAGYFGGVLLFNHLIKRSGLYKSMDWDENAPLQRLLRYTLSVGATYLLAKGMGGNAGHSYMNLVNIGTKIPRSVIWKMIGPSLKVVGKGVSQVGQAMQATGSVL